MPSAAQAEETLGPNDLSGKWNGIGSNNRMGDLVVPAGDINGDGIDDLLTMVDGAAQRGVWVLFGPGKATSPDLANLAPTDGYRIRTTSDAQWPAAVGDQNSDGVPDMVIGESPNGSKATVVYGVKDPATDLSECAPPALTRCVNTSDPVSIEGKRLGFKVNSPTSLVATGTPWDSGDLDGDGKEELLASAVDASQVFVMANGLGSDCPEAAGLCTIDIGSMDSPDLIKVVGTSGVPLAQSAVVSPGDVNDDGHDDIAVYSGTDGSAQPMVYVLYGQSWQGDIDLTEMTNSEGFGIAMPFSTFAGLPFVTGDVNGDGIADIGIQSVEIIPAMGTYFSAIYGKKGTPGRSLEADPPSVGEGVQFDWDPAFTALPFSGLGGIVQVSLGDLNGDGGAEFAATAPDSTIDGKSNAGRVVIFQSDVPEDQNIVTVSASTPASQVLSLGGNTANLKLGSGVASAGDVDDDGVQDIAVGASGYALTSPVANNAGQVGVIKSSRFYPQGTTGIASVAGPDRATVSGVANTNQRDSVAYFEFGTSVGYGQETEVLELNGSGIGRGVDSELVGLSGDTQYHYRLVVMNDLGIKAYGADRTFTTASKTVDRCVADSTLPGCPNESGVAFCERHPLDSVCASQGDPKLAGLSGLIVSSNGGKVLRGGKTVVWAWITSTGTKEATGLKMCANAPKRLVTVIGNRCRNVGDLAPGKTAKTKFKIKVKANAKRNAKAKIKFVASAGDGLGSRTATVRLTVR